MILFCRRYCSAMVVCAGMVFSQACSDDVMYSGVATVKTENDTFVFSAGRRFAVHFTPAVQDVDGELFWQDHRGDLISSVMRVSGDTTVTVLSPDDEPGYYSLVYQTDNAAREFGFVIHPSIRDNPSPDRASRFGVVHARYQDPYLPSWVKTLTWNTTGAEFWRAELAERLAYGKLELPLVSGKGWITDSSVPVSADDLLMLENKLTAYLSADPTVTYWELGLEENLTQGYRQEFYWPNLFEKVKVARSVADQVNPDIKLIYQIAGLSRSAIDNFARSDAATVFDVLSLHPYAWPEFPDPDEWYADYQDEARDILSEYNRSEMPLWVTEIGIPQHEQRFGGYFDMPSGRPARGSGWLETSVNLIKLHVISLQSGIGKVFWYNYYDRDIGSDDPENYFGLLTNDYSPRPAYAAYTNLIREIGDKQPTGKVNTIPGVEHYPFDNSDEATMVLWADRTIRVETSALIDLTHSDGSAVRVVNMVGAGIPLVDAYIEVGAEPVWITYEKH